MLIITLMYKNTTMFIILRTIIPQFIKRKKVAMRAEQQVSPGHQTGCMTIANSEHREERLSFRHTTGVRNV